MRDDELDQVIKAIKSARVDEGYTAFIGKASNASGLLRGRTHPAETTAPEGKSPEGQLRDQRMTPFLKRCGFGELLLSAPGAGGGGYWTIPDEMRDLVGGAISTPPQYKHCATEQEWIEWFCEGTISAVVSVPPPASPSVKIPISELTLSALKTALATYEPNLVFTDDLLASVVASLRSGDGRNFMILRGISGTGKSRLVAALAKAVYGSSLVDAPYLTIVEVRPDWTDSSSLLGHYDPVGCRYVRQSFLDAVLTADADKSVPVFVCLDEMNLARVEYYLADCLSAMESGNLLTLDTRDERELPRNVGWPSNLYLFGTINIDESTLPISDKVLDRAQVVDTSDIELLPQLEKWLTDATALDAAEKERAQQIVGQTWSTLRPLHAHFGFRAGRAIVRFLNEAKASSGGLLTVDDALDIQLFQKILVKLRGEGDQWESPLSELEGLFGTLKGKQRSHTAVLRMRQDLERLGSFQFWN